jgi:hypothetical protein
MEAAIRIRNSQPKLNLFLFPPRKHVSPLIGKRFWMRDSLRAMAELGQY